MTTYKVLKPFRVGNREFLPGYTLEPVKMGLFDASKADEMAEKGLIAPLKPEKKADLPPMEKPADTDKKAEKPAEPDQKPEKTSKK